MRVSTVITALCAGMAVASPLVKNVKKALVTDIVTTYMTVFVTEGAAPPSTSTTSTSTSTTPEPVVNTPPPAPKKIITTTSSSSTPPPPPPPATTSSAAPLMNIIAAAPKVQPTTTQEAAPVQSQQTQQAPSTGNSFKDIVLQQHNIHRDNHTADPFTYNDEIAGYAATLAKGCVYKHNVNIGRPIYGQNIAVYGTTANPQSIGADQSIGQAITDLWYNGEVDLFPSDGYGQPTPDMGNFEKWGHFSAMVWKNTESAGCAAQYCPAGTIFKDMGSWFSVCNYYPPGNVETQYGANVAKSKNLASETF